NLTGKYARNRVRLEVLPVLEELYPGAGANIARAADLVRQDLDALESMAARLVSRRNREMVVPLGALMEAPPALRRYAVRRAYAALAPEAPPLAQALVENVLRLAEGENGTRMLDLPGGVVVAVRFAEEVAFYRRPDVVDTEHQLRAGEASFGGWEISVREVAELDARDAARAEVAYLDEALGPYRVRYAREGDAIRPLGLGGTKKVLRAMMDRKVPRDLRRRMPVVVDRRDRVAWIFLGELDEAFAVTPATEKVLRMEVLRTP
ncbi:MAG TPA: tRNA lysidine(34) synthetase TilS, partial [Rubrobacteraceae bacterium]|nr:tRNA lysidine(34) synthetase TilS [Rubrobacteraceae bacterium]